MRENTASVPHRPGRMADLITRTTPVPAVRGRHRTARTPIDVQLHLLTLALGAVLAAAIYLAGGPW